MSEKTVPDILPGAIDLHHQREPLNYYQPAEKNLYTGRNALAGQNNVKPAAVELAY